MKLPLRLDGTGAATPAGMVLSSQLDGRIGRPEGWLYRRTGVLSRYYCGSEDQIDLAVDAGRQALEAAQAGNQLVALQAQQLADLTATVAAQGRAQSLEAAARVAAQDQAREQLRRFLAPNTGYQPSTVRMFHE